MTTQDAHECTLAPWRPWPPEVTGKRPLPRVAPRPTVRELRRGLDVLTDRLRRGEIQATLPAEGFDPRFAMDDLDAAIRRFRESEEAAAMSRDERDRVTTDMIFEQLEKYPEPQRSSIMLRIMSSLLANFDDET